MKEIPACAGMTEENMTVNSSKVGFVSLGCAKALVDSERILTKLRAEGYELAADYKGSDLVIVNTCGFLDSAREESLSAIGEALNDNGKVIVTGCLGAEPEVITSKFPNVLSVSGPANYEAVMDAVHRALPAEHNPHIDLLPPQGIKLTPRHYAYLKISEGCNNRCSFCIIPALRGDLVSRPVVDVLKEAETLAKAGVKELLVVSQDTSAYGVDMKYEGGIWRERAVKASMAGLAEALSDLGIWVRLHYVYPYPSVDHVLPLMAEGKILPYLDIPFQHASPQVLKSMRRPGNQEKTAARIRKWREMVPDITLRSTFIVGFPGETEEDFEFLLQWMDEVELDRLLQIRGCEGRIQQRAAEPGAGRNQERALGSLHGAGRRNLRAQTAGEGRHEATSHCRCDRGWQAHLPHPRRCAGNRWQCHRAESKRRARRRCRRSRYHQRRCV